jgi:hypothetical protein
LATVNVSRLSAGPTAVANRLRAAKLQSVTLQDKYRGWQPAEAVKAFAEYAGYVAEHLGHVACTTSARSCDRSPTQGDDLAMQAGHC